MNDEDQTPPRWRQAGHGILVCLCTAVVMSYGWRYRGTVGHEGGAMVPGAMLGLAACVMSRRSDWHDRAMVTGLCGAVGFAWGGSLSYMEQTAYLVTDSFPDVLYACSALFFLGGMWAGIGGAVLGFALTLSRSKLQRLAGPLAAVSATFLAAYLVFLFKSDWHDVYNRYTAAHFHDADFFPALTVIAVSAVYALLRREERSEAVLFLACGAGWCVGYLALTKFGGLSLAPPYRSEGWGGVLGIYVVLVTYLWRQRNRAALLLSLYGVLAGGFAFAVSYSMLRSRAEESVGFFMGLGMGLGFLKLEREGLGAASEDTPTKPLDLFAVFVMALGMTWINLRRTPMSWLQSHESLRLNPVGGAMPWVWFFLIGVLLSMGVAYGLYHYGKQNWTHTENRRNSAILLLVLIWVTLIASVIQTLSGSLASVLPAAASLIVSAMLSTAMLIPRLFPGRRLGPVSAAGSTALPGDARWSVDLRHGFVCATVPLLMVTLTWASLVKQDGPAANARFRFGPEAYWRRIAQVVGTWEVDGITHTLGGKPDGPATDAPATLEIKDDRKVVAGFQGGAIVADAHSWQHRDSVVWLDWYGRKGDPALKASLPMTIREGRLYITWPPKGGKGDFATYHKATSR